MSEHSKNFRSEISKQKLMDALSIASTDAGDTANHAIDISNASDEEKEAARSLVEKGYKNKDSGKFNEAIDLFRQATEMMQQNNEEGEEGEEKKTRFPKNLPSFHNNRYTIEKYGKLSRADTNELLRNMIDKEREEGEEKTDLLFQRAGKRFITPDERVGLAKEEFLLKKKYGKNRPKNLRKIEENLLEKGKTIEDLPDVVDVNTPKIQNLDHGDLLGMCVRKKPYCSSSDILDGEIWKECAKNKGNNNPKCRYSPSLKKNLPSCAKRNTKVCPDDYPVSLLLHSWRTLYDDATGIMEEFEKKYDTEYEEEIPVETPEEADDRKERVKQDLAKQFVDKVKISGGRRRKTRVVKRNKKKRTKRRNKNIKRLTKKRRSNKRKGTRKV